MPSFGITNRLPAWDMTFSMKWTARFDITVAFPMSCAEIEPGLRRCLLARFPYGLIYGMEDDSIVVIAVTHLHRLPRYWTDRVGSR
jgi:hypothetical protein